MKRLSLSYDRIHDRIYEQIHDRIYKNNSPRSPRSPRSPKSPHSNQSPRSPKSPHWFELRTNVFNSNVFNPNVFNSNVFNSNVFNSNVFNSNEIKKISTISKNENELSTEIYVAKIDKFVCCVKEIQFDENETKSLQFRSNAEIPLTNNSNVNLFIKEIELLRTLPTNSHFVEYIGCYYTSNSIKMILSLYSGSLYDCINTCKSKSIEFNIQWIIHVADHISKALYILHSRKIIHRDVKSMNVLYDGTFFNGSFFNETFVLSDFGEAVKMKNPQTHTIKGTISWSAPEIFQRCYSYGVDIWAFGMLLYEMMTLQIPYHDEKFIASAIIDAKTPAIEQHIMAKYADIIPLYENCITYETNKRADIETVRRMIETIKTLN